MGKQDNLLSLQTIQRSFVFSIIVPIYNSESWIQETIDCIIRQSLNFQDNIQLILVNNGSTDNSGKICEEVKRDFPENVVYVDLPQNIGPSGARNVGMDSVQGDYICFLDSDDYLSLNALELGAKFFEKIPKEIECVAIRTRCFEAIDEWEIYDYRFKQTGIIDILEYPTYFQFPTTQAFLRASVIQKYRFDTRLKHSEDMLFINTILLQNGKYGILKEAIYYYRKRKSADSLVSISTKREEWYCPPIEFNYLKLIELSQSIYGKVIEYVQELIMFELQWRFTNRLLETLSEEKLTRYCDLLHKVLQEIDDTIIWHQKSLSVKQKVAALTLKYGYNVLENSQLMGTELSYQGARLWDIEKTASIRFCSVEEISHGLKVDCELIQPVPINKLQIWIEDNVGMEYSVHCKPLKLADYLENLLLGQCEMVFEIPVRVGEYRICGVIYGHKFDAKLEGASVTYLKNQGARFSVKEKSFCIETTCLWKGQYVESGKPSTTKEFIKKILPPPTSTFNREMSALREILTKQPAEIYQYIQENFEQLRALVVNQDIKRQQFESAYEESVEHAHDTLAEMQKAVINEFDKLDLAIDQIKMRLNELGDSLRTVQDNINLITNVQEQKIYYLCDYEAQFIAENGFYEIREHPDFFAKYKSLVHDLDVESITTINRILSRHMAIKGHKSGDQIDLFTPEEKKIISVQRSGFYSNMPQIAPDVYACGKYLLSSSNSGMGFMETTIFEDCAGFRKLHAPQKVRNKDILDIGAFIGDSTVVLAQFTDKNIYAFEPGYGNYLALKKTLKMNECKNAIPIRAGIGACSGVANAASELSMGVVLKKARDENTPEEEVKVISVDEFVEQHSLQIGLIKVDVEGYEQDFLKGAEKTIKEQRPALLLSMYHNAADFFGLKPLLESWDLGYTFQVHKEENEHIHFDTMLIAEVVDNSMEGQ